LVFNMFQSSTVMKVFNNVFAQGSKNAAAKK